jgi:hypothetical protein
LRSYLDSPTPLSRRTPPRVPMAAKQAGKLLRKQCKYGKGV